MDTVWDRSLTLMRVIRIGRRRYCSRLGTVHNKRGGMFIMVIIIMLMEVKYNHN